MLGEISHTPTFSQIYSYTLLLSALGGDPFACQRHRQDVSHTLARTYPGHLKVHTKCCSYAPFFPRNLLLLLLAMLSRQFRFYAISSPALLPRFVGGGVNLLVDSGDCFCMAASQLRFFTLSCHQYLCDRMRVYSCISCLVFGALGLRDTCF